VVVLPRGTTRWHLVHYVRDILSRSYNILDEALELLRGLLAQKQGHTGQGPGQGQGLYVKVNDPRKYTFWFDLIYALNNIADYQGKETENWKRCVSQSVLTVPSEVYEIGYECFLKFHQSQFENMLQTQRPTHTHIFCCCCCAHRYRLDQKSCRHINWWWQRIVIKRRLYTMSFIMTVDDTLPKLLLLRYICIIYIGFRTPICNLEKYGWLEKNSADIRISRIIA